MTQISDLHTLDKTVTSVGNSTTFISTSPTKKERDLRHNTPIIHEDEDSDHEIINAYDDIDIQRTAPLVYENSEEDDDDETRIPFLPMPWNVTVQSAENAPLVQNSLHIDQVPSVQGTPQLPLQPASRIANSAQAPISQSAHPVQPAQLIQSAPLHTTVPRHPLWQLRPGHHHHLRIRHLRPTCLVIIVALSILVSIIIAIIIAFFPKSHPIAPPTAILIGEPILGNAVILHGGNFAPGESITYTIDVKINASTQGNALVRPSNSMSALLFTKPSERFASPDFLKHQIANSDGTFEATIPIDSNWRAGSTHYVFVYNHTDKLIKTLSLIVIVPLNQARLVGCVSEGAPILLGPTTEGSKQLASKTITLCTSGAGPVNWAVRWDQPWLQLNHSGEITAPQYGQLTLGASTNGLKPGAYKTIVIFSSKQSSFKVRLNVTFVVVKKATLSGKPTPQGPPPGVACVSVTP
ncbi:MAG: hypothetical protein M3Y76_06985, partial [Chloroflexota bacterium]|nr:hypothetical protein [Chloroflexota bacterium]